MSNATEVCHFFRAMGFLLLKGFARATGYRYRAYLFPRLEMPYKPDFELNQVQEKARASAAVSGIFLGFGAAFLVTILGKDFAGALDILHSITLDYRVWEKLIFFQTGVPALAGIILPVLPLLQERYISAARWDAKKMCKEKEQLEARRYLLLTFWIVICIVGAAFVSFYPSAGKLAAGLAFSGVALIVVSLLLLVLSVEFYDTAGGWQFNNNCEYHFHMASVASHCYVLGLSSGVVGISLLFCLNHVRAGCCLAIIVVLALTAMTEVERAFSNLRRQWPYE